jgi:hypothetical protein
MNITRIVSECKKYQYLSIFEWGEKSINPLGVVGLNPSIIKNGKNSTISILKDLAIKEGFDGLVVSNLYGYISPNPKDLKKIKDPIGKDNDKWIDHMKDICQKIICIWGNSGDTYRKESILKNINEKAYTVGLTKSGNPRHVLHTKKNLPLIKYKGYENAI